MYVQYFMYKFYNSWPRLLLNLYTKHYLKLGKLLVHEITYIIVYHTFLIVAHAYIIDGHRLGARKELTVLLVVVDSQLQYLVSNFVTAALKQYMGLIHGVDIPTGIVMME